MTNKPAGVLVPLTTPFDAATGDIAPVALRDNARAVLDQGVAGIVAAGSTGEAPMLSDAECAQTVEWLREIVPEDAFLMAGTGRESTRATIAACRDAATAGADAVLVRAPAYFSGSLSTADLTDHYRAIADASPVPVYVYNIPKYTHIALSEVLLRNLAKHENIHGAKDSSGDLKNLAAYRDAVPEWTLLVGSGALLYPALELGVAGGILGVGNFAAETAVSIYEAFLRGDRTAAGAAQERLTPLHQGIVARLGPAGIKVAMGEVGLVGGLARPPLGEVSSSDRTALVQLLRESSLIAA